MKLVLDVKGKPLKDDIIIYDGEKWECVCGKALTNELTIKHIALLQQVNDLEDEINTLKVEINKKLKEYHDILQVISKED